MEPSDQQRHAEKEVARLRAELAAAQHLAGRLREEAQAAERAKNEFLANIGHEIRTPMNAILGFCHMLLKEPLEPDQTEKLEYVHDAAESLLQLMNNVLNYSRLAAGELRLAHTPFELDAVLRDVMVATGDAARHKGLAIDYLVEDAVPYRFLGDGKRLGQVLGNLVGNAVKFTEHGEIHIRVSLDESDGRLAMVRVVVTDTGVGVPADRQQVIFDAFAQADGSSTRRFGGLGLGLSIGKQLVDLMGGQIGFRSQPGVGSSFWFTVPLPVCQESEVATSAGRKGRLRRSERRASTGRPAGAGRRPRILVADDDYLNRTLVEMLLGRTGCLIDAATTGREALDLAGAARYDLVLMDLQMPEMDGLTVIRHIRDGVHGLNRATSIVALTAHAMPSDREQCLEAGADEYLAKPFTPEALLAMVGRFLPGCPAESEAPAPCQGAVPRPDPPHLLQEYFQAVCRALGDRDFDRLEASAGELKNVSLGAGAQPIADHAMRVQLAARSNDLEEVTHAVGRLEGLLSEGAPASREGTGPAGRSKGPPVYHDAVKTCTARYELPRKL